MVILPDPTPGLNAALAAIDVTRAEPRRSPRARPAGAAHERRSPTPSPAGPPPSRARRAAGDALLAEPSRWSTSWPSTP